MFFHIDESGNTGNNLFDAGQPRLSYGVLAGLTNVDALGKALHTSMLRKLGVESLHASKLGPERIEKIAPQLMQLQEKMKFEFGFFFIEKKAYAVVQLFEAVFDAGMNEAVPWSHYWTPLRFRLIQYLSRLVDEETLRTAWELCTTKNIEPRLQEVVALMANLKSRLETTSFEPRVTEVMQNAFDFGAMNPGKLDFGFPDVRLMSPNAMCFQFVVADIARKLRKKRINRAVAITIDHQQQYNAAQLRTHENLAKISEGFKKASRGDRDFILNHPLYSHLTREEVLGAALPGQSPTVSRSEKSIGIQIVDIYLWIVNKVVNGNELAEQTENLARTIIARTNVDGVSFEAMANRFKAFEEKLPKIEQMSPQQLELAKREMERQRGHVEQLLRGDGG